MYRYIFVLILMMHTIVYAAQERSAQAQALLDAYKPTYNTCRPKLRMGASGPEIGQSLLGGTTIEPSIACMIAGFKDVSFIKYQKMSADIVAVLKEYTIEYILFDASRSDKLERKPNLFLYTPRGKRNAFLFVKSEITETTKAFIGYLYGFLLGYPEDDIKAFYQRAGFTMSEFESHKKDAQAWIEANSKDIEQWITDNAATYDLALGNFKEMGIFA